ncbi:MAG: 3-deoxy-D-manno-octulosonic acid transferase [Myxococcota bacterium]
MSASRAIVAALVAVVGAPLGLVGLALRPGWRVGLGERLGRLPERAAGLQRPIWLHAASAGEVAAASGLVERWRGQGRALYATSTSPSGRTLWSARHPDVAAGLAPLDHPWCVDRVLDALAPRALVLVEGELWPVLIAAAARRGIPVLAISARLSPRSFTLRRRTRRLWAPTLARLAAVGAAGPEDAERFAALGAPASRVRTSGDLKLAGAHPPPPPADDLRVALPGLPVWVAGCTHPGEEGAVAEALDRVEAEGVHVRPVVAPRHLERVPEVEKEWLARGRRIRRRSRLGEGPLEPGEALLVDTMGELASIYALADFAFVGGTLAPVGGHNLVEPVAAGVPVLHGPHVWKVRRAAAWLAGVGAAEEVDDADALGRALLRWGRDTAAVRKGAEEARSLLERSEGPLERSCALVDAVLDGAPLPDFEGPAMPGAIGETS